MTTARFIILYKSLLRNKKIKGQSDLADQINVNRSYISQILKAAPDRNVPKNVLEKVMGLFPELNVYKYGSDSNDVNKQNVVLEDRLESYQTSDGLEHEGLIYSMPNRLLTADELATSIPFYDIDFIAGDGVSAIDPANVAPSYTMKLPGFRGCMAFTAYSDSMEKIIKSGSILLGRKIDWQDYLEYGQVYGIVMTDNRRFLKYIRKWEPSPSTHYLLCSENPAYESFEIPKSKIHNIWLIEGWMQKRS